MKRIAITGYGIADSLGSDMEQCYAKMLGDYDPVVESNRFNLQTYKNIKSKIAAELYPDNVYNLHRCPGESTRPVDYVKIALHTVNQALDVANMESNSNGAVIFSSLSSDSNTRIDYIQALTSGKHRYSPRLLLEMQPDYISGCISQMFGITGLHTCVNGACATSLISLDYASRLVDEYDFVIVGAADIMTGPPTMFLFQQYGATTTDGSRPFDRSRNGFLFGEGAGCLILEQEDKAKARGAPIHGFLCGMGISSELNSPSGINRISADVAMKKALASAGTDEVDFVNAHATSTVLGDQAEYDVIKKHLPNAPIFSAKGKIGHTMGACGIIEIIYGLAVLKYGVIPRNFNLRDPFINDELLLTENLSKKCKSFIKNSYGFGGRSVSVVISGPD